MAAAEARKLTILKCSVAHTGTNVKGADYTIYNVEAVTEDGSKVAQELRSFEELPLGELREFEVKPYMKDGVLKNYTLALPRKGGALGKRVDELRGRIEEIEKRLEKAGL